MIFSLKGKIGNILGYMDPIVSVPLSNFVVVTGKTPQDRC